MSAIPALAGLISILIMAFYNLDEEKMKQIGRALEERRAAEALLSSV
jgi:Na+/melibiose symporter-like transporter